MKKLLIIFSAFLYLAVTSGLAIEMHYCMGKWVSAKLALSYNSNHTCGKCGMRSPKKGGCCHDEVAFVKLTDSHQSIATYHLPAYSRVVPDAVSCFFLYESVNYLIGIEPPLYCKGSPPGKEYRTLSDLHCIYRI